ncbi:MAG TPA: hypothetical protein VGG20_28350 [Thermoanaerobaculia bacterium]
MQLSSSLTSQPQSRCWPLVLLLVALFAVFATAQGMAQTQPAAVSPGPQVTAAAAVDVADFLATLSAPSAGDLGGLPPAPALASGCTSSAQCPVGQICCLACGYADCDRHACFATKTCPHFP